MRRLVCEVDAADAITFDARTIVGEEIRVPDEYAGVRVRLEARLAGARIPMQIDVGFGDAVVPAPQRAHIPPLLDDEPPFVLVYPREAVVAEKVEAMVSLGVTNSRMKDYYDIHQLSCSAAFDGTTLTRALLATFERRGTALPLGEPLVLAPGFLAAPDRQTQWRAFLRRTRLEPSLDTAELVEDLRGFLLPVLAAATQGAPFNALWSPGGPWRSVIDGTTDDA